MYEHSDNPMGLSALSLAEVDSACARFEAAWQSDGRPSIEDYLGASPAAIRPALLIELVLLDIDYRRRVGQHPSRDDYTQFHTDAAALLDTIFNDSETANSAATVIPAEATHLPMTLGRYRVIRCVGTGGFGTVYRAHDDELDRDVAIKVPHKHLAHRTTATDILRREARTLASLRHPAIVPVYDVGFLDADPHSCYIVSEFMPGGDLASRQRCQQMTHHRAAEVVERLARALHHAHAHQIVHRDVKLANVLLDHNAEVYLSDFGLALQASDPQAEMSGSFVGTPSSMSPEQVRGDLNGIDGRADIYGLGVVLYELLTGQKPFAGDDFDLLVESIKTEMPLPCRQIAPSVSGELERICLKTLAKDPKDRYQTAGEMADALRAYLAGPSQPRRSLPRFARIAAAIALGGVLAWWGAYWHSEPPAKTADASAAMQPGAPTIQSLAVLPFKMTASGESDQTTLEAENRLWSAGIADLLVTKLRNVRRLVVRSTASVTNTTEPGDDPVAAGSKLQVDAVLSGELRRMDGRTKASVRLSTVADGEAIWSGEFDANATEPFALHEAISTGVIKALAFQLSANEERRINLRYTDSRAAYEAYIKGRHAWQQRSIPGKQGVERAIGYFRAAIDADPLFALAYVGLAESYAMNNLYTDYDKQAYPRARAAAERALELDPQLTEAHAVLALVAHYFDWDFEEAEAGFKKAIQLNPNHASARQWYAELLYFSRRFDESIEQLETALRLDPLSPQISDLQGSPYLWKRDLERAKIEFEQALRRNPNSTLTLYCLGTIAMQEGRWDDAIRLHRQHQGTYLVAHALAQTGNAPKARELLAESIEGSYRKAIVYVGLQDHDSALRALEHAIHGREERVVWLLVEPRFDPLRDDPRFKKLLKLAGR